jgi:outer membrane protein OmpA-like peptidoglycan-associated protein
MATPSLLQQAQQAGPKTQTQTEESFLSYEPSQVFREELIIKNLKPYNIAGINSEPQGTVIYQQSQPDLSATEPLFSLDGTGFPVIFRNESPDNLIVPSTYLAYNIFKTPNPVGNNGPLSNDSYIAKIGAQVLKKSLLETNAFYIEQSLNAKTTVSFKITTPDQNDTFESKLGGSYVPDSPIPGDYFLDGLNKRPTDTAGEVLNLAAGQSTTTGGVLNGSLSRIITPSQIFLEYTTTGQKGLLLSNLSYNIFRPPYGETLQGGLFNNIATTEINNLVDNFGLQLPGAYYVGSVTSEPSFATNPINAVPIDVFGRDTQALVLGPDVLGKDYEGNEGSISFGLGSKALIDQGNLEGDLVWVSPKYRGGSSPFNSIRIDFKPGSILDDTQRLIESADRLQGEARLKHVGNAINQISTKFHDGYKEITKGSKAVRVEYVRGSAVVGSEYCRIFTKKNTYSRYDKLQKSDGITNFGRRFSYSVLDTTYNLNIYPTKRGQNGPTPSWAQGGKVKKYMFSIENLAWKDSKKPGFNVQDLPECERGPNGGRIMWFPPYDLKFGDNSTANWQTTDFLGRPEPIYTYKNTSRNGTLSWKIVVDHPSVLNLIVDKVLNKEIDSNADKVLESFFAGCQTYDLYDFAVRFNTVPLSDLQYIQEVISEATPEELQIIKSTDIPVDPETGGEAKKEAVKGECLNCNKPDFNSFQQLGFYFFNAIPAPSETNPSSFKNYYETYKNQKSDFESKTIEPNKASVTNFFDSVIIDNYEKVIKNNDEGLIYKIVDSFEKNLIKKLTITIKGCASALGATDYNKKLAERRIKSVEEFLKSEKVSSGQTQISLQKYFDGGKITVKGVADGEDAKNITPKSFTGSSASNVTACNTDPIIDGKPITGTKSIYLVQSMACRSVFINDIIAEPAEPVFSKPPPAPEVPATPPNDTNKNPLQVQEPVRTIRQTQGLSKKILRLLLSECNYFQALEQSSPFLYRSLKEKLKFFEPTFHSTTPEGLNSRITFLNQCLRPGDTIPTIGTDGRPIYNDAVNTAFGRPPVLILRIGDFYNTKIIPRNLQFNYEPLILDLNREGIGVQPMIVGVTLAFDIIGGMGLAKPVEDLQNALSFNYYANTEIYDERAVATEDVSKLDQLVLKGLLDKADEVPPPVVNNQLQNEGGTTIGTVISTSNNGDFLIGRITYREVIKNLTQELETYFKLVPNTIEQMSKNYNFFVWQYADKERIYQLGKVGGLNNKRIYGKAKNLDEVFKKPFEDVIKQIKNSDSNNFCPLVSDFLKATFKQDSKTITILKEKMISFINEKIEPEFINNVVQQLQPLNAQQQVVVDLIDKLNFVFTEYDGYIKSDGTPVIYKLSGNSMTDIQTDLNQIGIDMELYISELVGAGMIYGSGNFVLSNKSILTDQEKNFFMIMSQTFTDKNKLQEFSDYIFANNIIDGVEIKDPRRPKKLLNDILGLDFGDLLNLGLGQSYYDRYSRAKNQLEKISTNFFGGPDISRKFKTYGNFKLSSLTDDRKVDFTTNVPSLETQKEQLKKLYESVPTEGDTYNGKKFE